MLETISWGQYWKTIFVFVAIYYIALFLLFYKKGFFSRRHNAATDPASYPATVTQIQPTLFAEPADDVHGNTRNGSNEVVGDEMLMPLVHDMIQEIKEFTQDIAQRSYVKEEVIMGLQVIVKNYKSIESSPYYTSVCEYIKTECEERCALQLSEEEVCRIWMG